MEQMKFIASTVGRMKTSRRDVSSMTMFMCQERTVWVDQMINPQNTVSTINERKEFK